LSQNNTKKLPAEKNETIRNGDRKEIQIGQNQKIIAQIFDFTTQNES
jgi:hypothetical protein